jgi:hypothetical protein
MTTLILQQQIMQELQYIPEHKLAEIYDLIHYFRLGLSQTEPKTERKPGLFKEQLGDAFFEPLPEEELKAWESDI